MTIRLKEILKIHGISNKELAEKIDITKEAMSNIVTGKASPSANRLEQIANALNVPIWELFTDESNYNEVSGFVKIRNKIHEVRSFADLKQLLILENEK